MRAIKKSRPFFGRSFIAIRTDTVHYFLGVFFVLFHIAREVEEQRSSNKERSF